MLAGTASPDQPTVTVDAGAGVDAPDGLGAAAVEAGPLEAVEAVEAVAAGAMAAGAFGAGSPWHPAASTSAATTAVHDPRRTIPAA
jgi:hypothetical protein